MFGKQEKGERYFTKHGLQNVICETAYIPIQLFYVFAPFETFRNRMRTIFGRNSHDALPIHETLAFLYLYDTHQIPDTCT